MSEDIILAGRVITLLTQRLGMPREAVIPSAQLAEDLGVDSIDAVEFTLALEREFDVSLPDEALHSIRTVQDVIDLVRERSERPANRLAREPA